MTPMVLWCRRPRRQRARVALRNADEGFGTAVRSRRGELPDAQMVAGGVMEGGDEEVAFGVEGFDDLAAVLGNFLDGVVDVGGVDVGEQAAGRGGEAGDEAADEVAGGVVEGGAGGVRVAGCNLQLKTALKPALRRRRDRRRGSRGTRCGRGGRGGLVELSGGMMDLNSGSRRGGRIRLPRRDSSGELQPNSGDQPPAMAAMM